MEGKVGLLTAAERDDLSNFLLNITFPPAQRRAYTNELSDKAKAGFDQVWDIVLQGKGVLIDKAHTTPARLQSDPSFRNRIGAYVATKDSSNSFTRDELVTVASEGNFVGTFTRPSWCQC